MSNLVSGLPARLQKDQITRGWRRYVPRRYWSSVEDGTVSADLSTYLQQGLDEASTPSGGTLMLDAHTTFTIGAPLKMSTQSSLIGAGQAGARIKALPGLGSVAKPAIDAATWAPVLDWVPMLYNKSAVDYWQIEGVWFDGNNQDVYGLYLNENFHGSMNKVLVSATNKRPYTNIRGQSVTHATVEFFRCGDGVITYDNTGLTFTGCGWERLTAAWYLDQRQPVSFSKGGVVIENGWFESETANKPSAGFLRISGRRNRVSMNAAYHTTATVEELIRLNDVTDGALTVDGVAMGANPCQAADVTVNNSTGGMLLRAQPGTVGNDIRGQYSPNKVTDLGAANDFNQPGVLTVPVRHVVGRFQVRQGDSGAGIPIGATAWVIDADPTAAAPALRLLGNAGNAVDLNLTRLRMTGANGLDLAAAAGNVTLSPAGATIVANASGATGWQHPLYLGSYAFWVDSVGKLRMTSGPPGSDTAGVIVGTQT